MQKAIRLTDGWVICGKCGHKLARAYGEGGGIMWLFKCQSCKEINRYNEREDNEQGKRN